MKLYRIKNKNYEEKQVAAEDMGEALEKYRNYLRDHISIDYSDYEVCQNITSCTYVSEYQEDDVIV
jgi:hypothetical protein